MTQATGDMTTDLTRGFPDDIDVAVVSHNGRRTLPAVLDALLAAAVPPSRITLYDIASTDGTAAWIAGHLPAASVVTLERNEGPNPARNLALERATRPFLLLVDSDARLAPSAVTALRAAMSADPTIAAAVPVVVHADRPDIIQYAGARLHFICEAINPWSERTLAERGADTHDIGTAPGVTFLLAVALARRVGAFDARYFMGKEDGEFCYRVKLAGLRIVETPQAVALHESRPRTTWLFRYQIRNRWHFMLKNYQARTLIALAPALLLHEALQLAFLVAKGEFLAWCRGFAGLLAWLPALPADRRAVGAIRRVSDRRLLSADPLVVRKDLVGSGLAASLKSSYDAWLATYWRVASRLLE